MTGFFYTNIKKYITAYNPQQKLLDYCNSKNIHVTGYSPLGSTDSILLSDETVGKIATAHNKSPAQIILSWGLSRSSILPKSVNAEVNVLLFLLLR